MFKKILLAILLVVLIAAIGGFLYYKLYIYEPPLISKKDRETITLMPLPAKLKINNGKLDLSKGLSINLTGIENSFLEKAISRFSNNLIQTQNITINTDGTILNINCLSDNAQAIPQINDDESYSIQIGKEINLTANTHFGINHGLETILQLINANSKEHHIQKLEIDDNPRFRWRGIMLDVCRHWISKDVVLRTLDAMAAVKMNVFHWHLSEDQGFRVESKVFPKLHEVGSNGNYYTQEEIKEVIKYAADRGIRVIPEFDVPGHSKSWQIAYPELSTVSYKQKFGKEGEGLFSPPMDPTKEEVYEFLDKFIEEMAALFPDRYFHIGGDEVEPTHWNESESIQKFMQENELKDSHDLQAYFNQRIHKLVEKHGKTMVGWEEILHPDLADEIVIQSWKTQNTLFNGIRNGSDAILSAGWYLDHKLHAGKHYEVDPLILKGSINFEPDTSNWKSFKLNIDLPSESVDVEMVIFDKDSQNIYGFMGLLGSRSGFRNGKITEDEINFELESPVGKLDFTAELEGDSLTGKLSLALLKFPANGKLVGGSDIVGTNLPKIEVVKPLTEQEKSKVLGGEAAMWSEVVGETNVESRLWPRSAAIAEKLWSPAKLTSDIDDMYRRLEPTSNYLAKRGSYHILQMDEIISKLIPPDGLPHLTTLVELLEEVKYYDRLSTIMHIENLYLPNLPLYEIVDAARPESLKARHFNKLVTNFLDNKEDTKTKQQILFLLETWHVNHEKLNPYLTTPELKKAQQTSDTLANVSLQIINRIKGKEIKPEEKTQLIKAIQFLENGENGFLVAVSPGLLKLANNL